MHGFSISKFRRLTAGVMGIILLAVVLFSAVFIFAEADHDCSGDGCHICSCIRMCCRLLRLVHFESAAALSFSAAVSFLFFLSASAYFSVPETPVSVKVRLNN